MTTPTDSRKDGGAVSDAFHDGVILALQVMNAGGDNGCAHYEELVRCCGFDALYERAKADQMLDLSGLREYRRVYRQMLAARSKP